MKMQNVFLRNSHISIYEKTAICIIFMSDAAVMTGKFSPAGVSDFIAVLAASFLCLPFAPLAAFTVKRCQNSIILRFFAAVLSAVCIIMSLAVFSNFIKTCVLPELNRFIVPTAILLTAFYSAFRNTKTLTRAVHVVMPAAAVFCAAAFFIALTRARSENISYIIQEMENTPLQIIFGAAAFAAVFIVKIILLMYLFSFSDNTHGNCAAICAGTAIYGIIISAMLLTAGAVLGAGLYLRLDYPLYYPLGLTGLGNYLERTEIISVIIFMVLLVFKTGIFIRIIFTACSVRKQFH